MTNTEKLVLLVQRARSNGWDMTVYADWAQGTTSLVHGTNWYQLIFNHDFARALFGDEDALVSNNSYGAGHTGTGPAWKMHLQQAVISDDPIDYMYSVVFDEQ
jgi:hypothetical protein